MPPGANPGGQLNIVIFEVGFRIDREDLRALGRDVITVAVHPLLVVPESFQYSQASRSSVVFSLAGQVKSNGGRAPWMVQLSGTFGVESRGMGPYIGTGDVRLRRFTDEVVRLGEARSQGDVDACRNLLTESIGIGLPLQLYDEDVCQFFVNFYDLWHDRAFEVHVQSLSTTRGYRNAGATGLTAYNLSLRELGPLVRGGIGSDLLGPLMDALVAWDQANALLQSATVDALLQAVTGPAAIVGALFSESVATVQDTVDAVQALFGASAQQAASSNADAGSSWLDGLESAITAGEALQHTLDGQSAAPVSVGTPDGILSGATLALLGADLDRFANLSALSDVLDGLRMQRTVGALFGLAADDFRALVASGAPAYLLGAEVRRTRAYTVSPEDTADRIEARFGVPWGTILSLNDLTPLEALRPGTRLQIPLLRARGPRGVDGLPVFGSQVGEALWGVDLALELDADADGDFRVVSGEDNLVQAADLLVAQAGADLLSQVDHVPPAGRPAYLARRAEGALAADKRFEAVQATVEPDESGAGYTLTLSARAVGGVQITTQSELS